MTGPFFWRLKEWLSVDSVKDVEIDDGSFGSVVDMPQFIRGDRVVLKSGGPVMTVLGTLTKGETASDLWLKAGWEEGAVLCQWWDEKHKPHTHPFQAEWLKPAGD